MKIAMIGSGYVGLVSGAGFAEFGNSVICADLDQKRVDKLNDGILPIYEPSLDELVAENVKEDRLLFTTDVAKAIEISDVVFITVGTPQAPDGSADLSQVYSVARSIGEVLTKTHQPDKIIVVKSTVPVGTTKSVGKIISSFFDASANIANNPEFLREGTALSDFMRPDRIVIGTESKRAQEMLLRLYRPFTNVTQVLVMDSISSELVKYASNSLLATRVSFMNELANLTSALGADVDHVREGLGADHRIGPKYLYPGPGYGGSCFPKDVSAMLNMADQVRVDLKVIRAAQDANDVQRHILSKMMADHFGGYDCLSEKKVCLWGTAFKAETDDVRDSPALVFIDDMLKCGASVSVHDPQALESTKQIYGSRIEYSEDMYSIVKDADAFVVCTEWRQYRNPDFQKVLALAPKAVVFDGRNIWDKAEFESRGITYFGIGRGNPGLKLSNTISTVRLKPVQVPTNLTAVRIIESD